MTKIVFMWLYLAGDHGDDKERVSAWVGEEEKRWRAKVRLRLLPSSLNLRYDVECRSVSMSRGEEVIT